MISDVVVFIKKLEHFKGELPKYETLGSSGLDVRAQLSRPLVVERGQIVLVPTGLCVEIPFGYEIQVRPRSGWAIREGLTVINAPGTVDADFRGEVKIGLVNLGTKSIEIQDQDRIAQMVLCPVHRITWKTVDQLSSSSRDSGSFGSTGRQ